TYNPQQTATPQNALPVLRLLATPKPEARSKARQSENRSRLPRSTQSGFGVEPFSRSRVGLAASTSWGSRFQSPRSHITSRDRGTVTRPAARKLQATTATAWENRTSLA